MESLSNRDLLNRFVGKSRVWILKKRFLQKRFVQSDARLFELSKVKCVKNVHTFFVFPFCLRSNTKKVNVM